jgi:hypothetical protein
LASLLGLNAEGGEVVPPPLQGAPATVSSRLNQLFSCVV